MLLLLTDTEEEDSTGDQCPSFPGLCLSLLTLSVLRLAGRVPAGLTRDRDTPGLASLEWKAITSLDDYEDGAHDWNPETRPDRWVAFPKERNCLKHVCVCVPEGASLRCVLTETSGTNLSLVTISETGLSAGVCVPGLGNAPSRSGRLLKSSVYFKTA